MFKPSSSLRENVTSKILVYGPSGAGKTHGALTWPLPAGIDLEGRMAHFAGRVQFMHCYAPTIKETREAFQGILKLPLSECASVLLDSATHHYLRLVEEHTTCRVDRETGEARWSTDWQLINRRMFELFNFIGRITDRNAIVTMHEAPKLERKGNDFKTAGTHILGPEQLRYAFDYVFRLIPQGEDPRVKPPLALVEKSASPHLRIGARIPFTYEAFIAATKSSPAAAPPAAIPPVTVQSGVRDVGPQPASVEAVPAASPAPARVPEPSVDPIAQDLAPHRADTRPVEVPDRDAKPEEFVPAIAGGLLSGGQIRQLVAIVKAKQTPIARFRLFVGAITGAIGQPLNPQDLSALIERIKKEQVA